MAFKKQIKMLAVGLLAATGMFAHAQQILTWDPGLSTGANPGGPGTWNLNATANWYNGTIDIKWTDNSPTGTNVAIFSGATAGTVTLSTSLSASNLQFTTAGYTLSGSGVLTLGGGGINASALGSGTTTVSTPLALPGLQELWQVGPGATLAVNSVLSRNTGASVDFTTPGITSTSSPLVNNATGIIGAWATTGNAIPSNATGDWAANDGSGNIITYTGYTMLSGGAQTTGTGPAAQNWNNAGEASPASIAANATINTLNQQGDFSVADGATLTLGGGGLIMHGISRWLLDNGGGNVRDGGSQFRFGQRGVVCPHAQWRYCQ